MGRGDFVSRFSRSKMLLGNDASRDQMAQIPVEGRQGHAPPSCPQAFMQRTDIPVIRSGDQRFEDFAQVRGHSQSALLASVLEFG
ncbi:hypothetical protein EV291_115108 [Rhizobium sp. BK068]|nr:hypothetical protein EV291_115108 [Rhizobium sp. BK068]